jgi:hypothetical protein
MFNKLPLIKNNFGVKLIMVEQVRLIWSIKAGAFFSFEENPPTFQR